MGQLTEELQEELQTYIMAKILSKVSAVIATKESGQGKSRAFIVAQVGPIQMVLVMTFKFAYTEMAEIRGVVQAISLSIPQGAHVRGIFVPLDGTQDPAAGTMADLVDGGYVDCQALDLMAHF